MLSLTDSMFLVPLWHNDSSLQYHDLVFSNTFVCNNLYITMHYVCCVGKQMSKWNDNLRGLNFVLHDHRRENRNTNFVISGDGSAT